MTVFQLSLGRKAAAANAFSKINRCNTKILFLQIFKMLLI